MNLLCKKFKENGLLRLNFGVITPDDMLELTKEFGKPLRVGKHHLNNNRLVQEVSEDKLFGNMEVDWHSDFSYSPGDFHGTILYNNRNGHLANTYFSNIQTVYDCLSEDEKYYYEDIMCHFYPNGSYKNILSKMQLKMVEKSMIKRPLVVKNPLNNRKGLYCSPATFLKSSKNIDINKLLGVINLKMFTYKWKDNDILIFDNLRFLHKRDSFIGDRSLLRTQFSYSGLMNES